MKLGKLAKSGVHATGVKWTHLHLKAPGLEEDMRTAGQLFKKGIKQVMAPCIWLQQFVEPGLFSFGVKKMAGRIRCAVGGVVACE